MKIKIFYSWQSDLKAKHNRSFIQEAITIALRKEQNSEVFSFETFLDRDTYGLPGSPSIVDSICTKIADCDIFVGDVSIISKSKEKRSTPNPNVLFELGYASSILGWERIILIQNSAFGGPDKLPFDLRGRRILHYHLDDNQDDKPGERKKLIEKLSVILSKAFDYYKHYVNPKEKPFWWGKWNMHSSSDARGGVLTIQNVSSDSFYYLIEIFDGARSGEVQGKARILTPHSALSQIRTVGKDFCEILFHRKLNEGIWQITLQTTKDCSFYHGFNTAFDGTYKHEANILLKEGYLDEVDIIEIARITKEYFPLLNTNFQQIDYKFSSGDYIVITGGVKGLYSIMESIIIVDKSAAVWCACIDAEKDAIRCFYSIPEAEKSLPPELTEWLNKFPQKVRIVTVNGIVVTI